MRSKIGRVALSSRESIGLACSVILSGQLLPGLILIFGRLLLGILSIFRVKCVVLLPKLILIVSIGDGVLGVHAFSCSSLRFVLLLLCVLCFLLFCECLLDSSIPLNLLSIDLAFRLWVELRANDSVDLRDFRSSCIDLRLEVVNRLLQIGDLTVFLQAFSLHKVGFIAILFNHN